MLAPMVPRPMNPTCMSISPQNVRSAVIARQGHPIALARWGPRDRATQQPRTQRFVPWCPFLTRRILGGPLARAMTNQSLTPRCSGPGAPELCLRLDVEPHRDIFEARFRRREFLELWNSSRKAMPDAIFDVAMPPPVRPRRGGDRIGRRRPPCPIGMGAHLPFPEGSLRL